MLALLVARRWRQTAIFVATLLPGLFLLALWKQRGLGQLPAFSGYGGTAGTVAAIDPGLTIASLFTPFHKYVNLNWHQLHQNIDGVREFFWAVRPLEFVPLAGLLAIGRRSWPKAVLVFGWFATFLLIKGTDDQASVEDASFFRLLMPSFPAFLLLLAALPLLVPSSGLTRRIFTGPAAAAARAGNRTLGVAAAVLVVLPLIVVAGTSPQSRPIAVSYPAQDVYIPVEGSFRLRTVSAAQGQRLTWDAPYDGSTSVFYTVLRSPAVYTDPSVERRPEGVDGIACRDRVNGSVRRLPPVHDEDRLDPDAGVQGPPAAGPLDLPGDALGELGRQREPRRRADGQHAGRGHDAASPRSARAAAARAARAAARGSCSGRAASRSPSSSGAARRGRTAPRPRTGRRRRTSRRRTSPRSCSARTRQSESTSRTTPVSEPEQRVALAQPAAADQLEHDQDQHDRGDGGGDRDGERRHLVSSSGVTFLRNRPTNEREHHLDHVVDGGERADRRAAGGALAHLHRHLGHAAAGACAPSRAASTSG